MSSRQETLLMQIITEFETAGIENIQAIGEAFDSVKDLDFDKQATAITAGLKKALGQESPELDSAMQEYAKKVGDALQKHLSDVGSGGSDNVKALSSVFKTLGVDGGEVLKVIGPMAQGFGNIAGVVGPLLGPLAAVATAYGVISKYGGETIIINEQFHGSLVSIAREAPGQLDKVQAAFAKMSNESGKDIKEIAAVVDSLRGKVRDTDLAMQLTATASKIAAGSGKEMGEVTDLVFRLSSGVSATTEELLRYGLTQEEINKVGNNTADTLALLEKRWLTEGQNFKTNTQLRAEATNTLKNTLTGLFSGMAQSADDAFTYVTEGAAGMADRYAELATNIKDGVWDILAANYDVVAGTDHYGKAMEEAAKKSAEALKTTEAAVNSPKLTLDKLINDANLLKQGFQSVAEESFNAFVTAMQQEGGINTLKKYEDSAVVVAELYKRAGEYIEKLNVDLDKLSQREIVFGVDESSIVERMQLLNKQVEVFVTATEEAYKSGAINEEEYSNRNAAAAQMIIDNDRKVIASKEQLLNLQTETLSSYAQLEGDITGLTEEANLERLKLEINSTATRLSLYENFHDERVKLEKDLTSLIVQEYKTRKDLFFRYANDVIDVQKSINSFQEITSGTNTEKRMQLIDSEIQLEQELMKTVDTGSEQYVTSSNKVLALMAQRKTALVETLEYQKNASLYLIELDNTLDSLGENSTDKRIALTQDKLKAEVDAMEKYINAERLTGRQALEARKELNSKSVELLNSYEDETNQFLQRMLSGQFGAAATELNDVALNNMKAQIEPLVKNAGSMTRKELQSAVAEYFYSGSPILTEMQNLTDEGKQEWQNILADMVRSTTDMQEKYGEVRGDIQKNKAEIEEISAVDSFDSLATEADRTTKAFSDLSSVLENIVGDKMSGAKVALDKSALEMKQAMDNFSKTAQTVGTPTNTQQRPISDTRLLVDALNKMSTQQKTIVEETVKGVMGAMRPQQATQTPQEKPDTTDDTERKIALAMNSIRDTATQRERDEYLLQLYKQGAGKEKEATSTINNGDVANPAPLFDEYEKGKLMFDVDFIGKTLATIMMDARNREEKTPAMSIDVVSKLADGLEKIANAVSTGNVHMDDKKEKKTVSLNITPTMFENLLLEISNSLRKEI